MFCPVVSALPLTPDLVGARRGRYAENRPINAKDTETAPDPVQTMDLMRFCTAKIPSSVWRVYSAIEFERTLYWAASPPRVEGQCVTTIFT